MFVRFLWLVSVGEHKLIFMFPSAGEKVLL